MAEYEEPFFNLGLDIGRYWDDPKKTVDYISMIDQWHNCFVCGWSVSNRKSHSRSACLANFHSVKKRLHGNLPTINLVAEVLQSVNTPQHIIEGIVLNQPAWLEEIMLADNLSDNTRVKYVQKAAESPAAAEGVLYLIKLSQSTDPAKQRAAEAWRLIANESEK